MNNGPSKINVKIEKTKAWKISILLINIKLKKIVGLPWFKFCSNNKSFKKIAEKVFTV